MTVAEQEKQAKEQKEYVADKSTPVLWECVEKNPTQKHEKDLNVYQDYHFEKSKEYFHIMPHEEPHTLRRRAILEKYPQIKNLFVKDSISAYITAAIVVFQLISAYYIQHASWPVYLTYMYVVGATLNHTMQALVHDLTHLTAFDSVILNRIFAFLSNVPTCIPSAMTFQHYHREHHLAMGDPKRDTDLPTEWEIRTFNRPWKKIIFISLHPLFYAVRPFYIAPKGLGPLEIFNLVLIMSTNFSVYYFMGPFAFLYLALSGFISMGLHPMAMHTIAEHYEFVKGQESYDYIGIANFFNLNLGYHIEHHDFPQVPWRLLPKVRAMAPEFYENIPVHTSYLRVGLAYLFDDDLGPFARIDTSETKLKKKD
ncbi:hypothetical protein ABPG74_015713 [Tetrahymena malaccensis]